MPSTLHKARLSRKLSQRQLAALSGVSFRTIQLLETGRHDPQISTLQKIALSLGYPKRYFMRCLDRTFERPVDSIVIASERILEEGVDDWRTPFFDFVDSFRRNPDRSCIESAPDPGLPRRLEALFAATVETLCNEKKMPHPRWPAVVPSLPSPWFVAAVENLKAAALMESGVPFRMRNIFVLENFLDRA